MAQFLKVGSRTEFEDLEGGKLVEAGGQSIAILIWAGAITPSRITCPRRGGPLAEGMMAGDER
jgi:hypothetical protein